VRDAVLHQVEEKGSDSQDTVLCKFVKCYKHLCL
jgi:hypothetical protein